MTTILHRVTERDATSEEIREFAVRNNLPVRLEVQHENIEYLPEIKTPEPEFECDACQDSGYYENHIGEQEKCPECNFKRSIEDEMDDDS